MSEISEIPRTVCGCDDCRRPCRHVPGALAPHDVAAIAGQLGLATDSDEFLDLFQASDGAKVVSQGVVFNVPSVVPRLTPSGCVFLDEEGMCRIHSASPFGCSRFDSHQPADVAMPRVSALIREQMRDIRDCGPLVRLRDRLVQLGRLARPLAERREAEARETAASASAMLGDRPAAG